MIYVCASVTGELRRYGNNCCSHNMQPRRFHSAQYAHARTRAGAVRRNVAAGQQQRRAALRSVALCGAVSRLKRQPGSRYSEAAVPGVRARARKTKAGKIPCKTRKTQQSDVFNSLPPSPCYVIFRLRYRRDAAHALKACTCCAFDHNFTRDTCPNISGIRE